MKVMFVADCLGSGGKERQLVELLKGLDRRSDVTYTLCLLSREIHYDDSDALQGNIAFFERGWRYDPTIFYKLHKVGSEFKPDVVQSWDLMSAIYSMPVAKALGSKFVSVIRNAPEDTSIFGDNWVRSRLTYTFSDYILANSMAGLAAYNIDPGRSRCIHNGFDLGRTKELKDPSLIRERFSVPTEKVVGMVAKFHTKKDNPTFIRAAVEICRVRDDVTFLAVGEDRGPKFRQCQMLVPDKFRNRILFVGKQANIESIVNIFDVGVLATFTEGISNSIMEYMALAKPVVVSESPGTRELVIENETGFLVPVSDPVAMAGKIVFLLDHPEQAERMGRAGRERIETDFALDKMTSAYVDAYRSCLSWLQDSTEKDLTEEHREFQQ